MLLMGNIVALLASIFMVCTGLIKSKKKILVVQSIQILLFIISNIILGGITGAIVNAIGFIRNLLCYYDKLKEKEKLFLSILIIIIPLLFNNLGLIGLLPIISTILYIWLMDTKSIIKFKRLIAFTSLCWLIYDILIKSYSSALFDFLTIITSIYTIRKLFKTHKH